MEKEKKEIETNYEDIVTNSENKMNTQIDVKNAMLIILIIIQILIFGIVIIGVALKKY